MHPKKIEQLQNVCKVVSKLKSQLIQELPHYGHQALFFQNDEITTGQLNNKTEIKIHLLTGRLLFFHNEEGFYIDLIKENISEKLQPIAAKYNLKLPEKTLENVNIRSYQIFMIMQLKQKEPLSYFDLH